MREGSLDAPTRHPIPWEDPDYYDEAKLDTEMRRVFDICHGCRRCFNLCDSFPTLFDLIDDAPSGELDTVDSKGFKSVVDGCTLCDMCFMAKCPYVPPHHFDLDFPHLMLRYRAIEHKKGETGFADRQLTETDRNGKIATSISGIANWGSKRGNKLTRPLLEKVAGVHRDAELPEYTSTPLTVRAEKHAVAVNDQAPAHGRKAVLYATCFANFNEPDIGEATRKVLGHNGVETTVQYPGCCGMPQLELGDIARVAESARTVAADMVKWIDDGYDIVALVPSCALMLKFEWPLILPDDPNVRKLAAATYDSPEYVVDIAKKEGLVGGLAPLAGDVTVHIACHSRAQNMGQKATEMLRLLPDTKVTPLERCSGHGGSWGIKKETYEVALKVGKPVAKQAVKAVKAGAQFVVSECPLAQVHLLQGMEREGADVTALKAFKHPIELIAHAYGL